MSWLKLNVHLKCSFFVPLLLAIAALLLPGLNANAAAGFVTLDDEKDLADRPPVRSRGAGHNRPGWGVFPELWRIQPTKSY